MSFFSFLTLNISCFSPCKVPPAPGPSSGWYRWPMLRRPTDIGLWLLSPSPSSPFGAEKIPECSKSILWEESKFYLKDLSSHIISSLSEPHLWAVSYVCSVECFYLISQPSHFPFGFETEIGRHCSAGMMTHQVCQLYILLSLTNCQFTY